jgi:hypothetical protein
MARNREYPGSTHPIDFGCIFPHTRGAVTHAAAGGAAHRRVGVR